MSRITSRVCLSRCVYPVSVESIVSRVDGDDGFFFIISHKRFLESSVEFQWIKLSLVSLEFLQRVCVEQWGRFSSTYKVGWVEWSCQLLESSQQRRESDASLSPQKQRNDSLLCVNERAAVFLGACDVSAVSAKLQRTSVELISSCLNTFSCSA